VLGPERYRAEVERRQDQVREAQMELSEALQANEVFVHGSPTLERRPEVGALARTPDELNSVGIRVSHERDEGAALPNLIRRALRFDAVLLQASERLVQVVHPDSDVPIAGAHLVRASVVVVRQLEHVLLVADREEVVRRLQLAVADDVHLAREPEPERLIEHPTLRRVGDPDHRVQEARHAQDPSFGLKAPEESRSTTLQRRL